MIIRRLLTHSFLQVLAILYVVMITILSLWRFIAFNPIPIANGDKIGHAIAYCGFTMIWFAFYFFSEKLHKNWKQSVLRASIIAFLWGLLMELAQGALTDYRMPEYLDVMANTSGIVLAVLLLSLGKKPLSLLKSR